MENEKLPNQFQEVHRQVQERLAREREKREQGVELRKKEVEKEGVRPTDDPRVSRLPN
jgi:hypothetical protein